MKYIISGHGSFHIREGWLNKGFRKIFNEDIEKRVPSTYFSKKNQTELIDQLGVGSVMVDSIKFWLEILEIIEKTKSDIGLSECSKVIFQKDRYLQNINSLWLLHSNIFYKNEEVALIWNLVFDKSSENEFSKESLEKKAELFCKEKGIKYSKKTLQDSISVFLKVYSNENEKILNPEDNMISPFLKLKYLEKTEEGLYKIRKIDVKEVSEYLIYHLLVKKYKGYQGKVQISLVEAYEYIYKVIRLSYLDFEKAIEVLENKNELNIDRAVGLNMVTIDMDKNTQLEIFNKILGSEQ